MSYSQLRGGNRSPSLSRKSASLVTAADDYDLDVGKWRGGLGPYYNELLKERARYRRLLNTHGLPGSPQIAVSSANNPSIVKSPSALPPKDDPFANDPSRGDPANPSKCGILEAWITFNGMFGDGPTVCPNNTSPTASTTEAEKWRKENLVRARQKLDLDEPTTARHTTEATKLIRNDREAASVLAKDQSPSRTVLICPPTNLTARVKNLAIHQWEESLLNELNDAFYHMPSARKLIEYLQIHRETPCLLRICQLQASDEKGQIEEKWPKEATWAEELVELSISFIPVVGSAVTLYEVAVGHDLFGNPISPAVRALMAASILVPLAGRFAKAGRPLYSAERLATLLGKTSKEEVKMVAKVLEESANASKSLAELHDLAHARSAVFSRAIAEKTNVADSILVKQATNSVQKMMAARTSPSSFFHTLEASESERLAALTQETLKALRVESKVLDGEALIRLFGVQRTKKSLAGVKGQLLEELGENRIMPLLNTPHGALLLGLDNTIGTGVLEFWPGHQLLALSKRQLTDGLIIRRLPDGKISIVAIVEAKSGLQANINELISRGVEKISESRAFVAEVRQAVADQVVVWIRHEGKRWKSVKDLLRDARKEKRAMERLAKSHHARENGQFVVDLQRLETDKAILYNGSKFDIELDPKNIRLLAIVPLGSSTGRVEKELSRRGLSFTALEVGFDRKRLDEMAGIIGKQYAANQELLSKVLDMIPELDQLF
ncbi:MAG: hypothetical protein Q9206_005917 [Seirophora lacunosa]